MAKKMKIIWKSEARFSNSLWKIRWLLNKKKIFLWIRVIIKQYLSETKPPMSETELDWTKKNTTPSILKSEDHQWLFNGNEWLFYLNIEKIIRSNEESVTIIMHQLAFESVHLLLRKGPFIVIPIPNHGEFIFQIWRKRKTKRLKIRKNAWLLENRMISVVNDEKNDFRRFFDYRGQSTLFESMVLKLDEWGKSESNTWH